MRQSGQAARPLSRQLVERPAGAVTHLGEDARWRGYVALAVQQLVLPGTPLLSRKLILRALLLLTAAGALTVAAVHGQAPVGHWCSTTFDLPEGPPPPRSVLDYQRIEAPAASETVVIGVLFLHTDDFTALQVRRRSVEWLKTANQLLNNGTAGYRIVLKRAGVRAAPESISRLSRSAADPMGAVLRATRDQHNALDPVRKELGADLVTVVIAPGPETYAGKAFLWDRRQSASRFVELSYSVIEVMGRSSWGGGWVLAHEIGHNLGLVHDRDSLRRFGNEDPAEVSGWLHDPHGFGYRTSSFSDGTAARGGAGTVMGFGPHYMLGFSGPGRTLGVRGSRRKAVAGDSTTNADRALRATAHLVAAFYEAAPNDPDPPPKPDPDPPPEPDPGPPPTGSEPCFSADGKRYCHATGFGPFFAVQFFHEGEWRFAEVAVSSGDSAVVHFFGADNLEVFAKVLNGCAIDGSVWVYASGLTDLPLVLHVWPEGGGQSEPFQVPDGTVLRPQNGGRLNWCR